MQFSVLALGVLTFLSLHLTEALPFLASCSVTGITQHIRASIPSDLRAYPFKVGDYNREVVAKYGSDIGGKMSLPYVDDTVGFVIFHGSENKTMGDTFERLSETVDEIKSLDCQQVKQLRLIHANAFNSETNLPYVAVQLAAHESGGAFHYQRHHVENEPDSWEGKSIFGVVDSADFEEFTMITAVMIMEELVDAGFEAAEPIDVWPEEEQRIALLNEVNGIFG